jgi:hypothetical protein
LQKSGHNKNIHILAEDSNFFIILNFLILYVLHHESLNNANPTSFSFDFEKTKILAQESNTQRSKLAEAAQIWLQQRKNLEENNKVYIAL